MTFLLLAVNGDFELLIPFAFAAIVGITLASSLDRGDKTLVSDNRTATERNTL